MSTPVRYDQQYCPIARGLDMLGDRWTLLIVRELTMGPQRFSELQLHLPGIAATVLSDRLRSMSEDGLVELVPTDPPSRRNRYGLGPLGRRAVPVLSSLLRFGMPLLEPPSEDSIKRPSMIVRAAITAYYDPIAADGVIQHYEIRVDGDVFTLDAHGAVVTDTADPDLVVTAPAHAWIAIRQQRSTFGDLLRSGEITAAGSAQALERFRSIYRLTAALASDPTN
jgi:DNA-binding HxlR family transcriptional regulator